MTSTEVCRMCLAVDTQMYTIADTPLQKIYEKMTDIMLQTEDGRPVLACYLCHHLLKKSDTFIKRSVIADGLLKEILARGVEITEKSVSLIDRSPFNNSLVITNTDRLNIDTDVHTLEVPVKVEQFLVKREGDGEMMEEIEVDFSGADQTTGELEAPPLGDQQSSSESEDDVPLKVFSTKNADKRVEKKRKAKIRQQNHEESKKLLENVSEIYLTKEEQLAEVLARAKSLNYLNSPYKCDLCYKGFVDARAFDNHNDKHSERSGPLSCAVCRLRYRSERLLRAHALTAHARRYACARCAHRSHTANQAREHERWHNGHTYECQLCSHTFRKPTSYLTHMRKRHPTGHVCADCGLGFVGRHGLLMHRSKAHCAEQKDTTEESETSVCADCNVQFRSREAWQRHILTSIKHAAPNANTAACLWCGVSVPAAALRAHVREHAREHARARAADHARQHGSEPPAPRLQLPCEQCGAKFSSRSKVLAHVRRVHLGLKYDRRLVCEVCGKNCTSNASLKYHQRTHTGERPHGCAACGKRFADRNQLRIHARTHSGDRPYCCAACGKRFSQKPALNRHYRIHTGAKPYACQFCAKTFSQSNSLKLHVSAVHLKLPQNKKKAAATAPEQAS